uniref:Uncharacterized protein n=1 Tax=Haemonchus contortus TaxID=6289 RepID=A0A7I5ECA9_HAECO
MKLSSPVNQPVQRSTSQGEQWRVTFRFLYC